VKGSKESKFETERQSKRRIEKGRRGVEKREREREKERRKKERKERRREGGWCADLSCLGV
jgi:hypothetical protein